MAERAIFDPVGTRSDPRQSPSEPPLVLDVDDALIRTDLLHESALLFLKPNLSRLFQLLLWLFSGRAALKRALSHRASLNIDLLPVNAELEEYAREAHRSGRRVGIATAADELLARRIMRRFDFASFVIASDGATNLKGERKARALTELFPEGFAYAGDSAADLSIWEKSDSIILVGANGRVTRAAQRLGKPVEATFPRPSISAKSWFKILRAHQWAKNALVFVPLILSGNAGNVHAWGAALLAFMAMSLLASGTYFVNDLFDLADDRLHPTKRNRPLASGLLRIREGVALSSALIAASLVAGFALGPASLGALVVYLITTISYSFHFKRQPIVDAVVLAALFTLRIVLGITAIGVTASPWLLVFSMFLFVSLAFAKRQTELQRNIAEGRTSIGGRGYLTTDTALILALGVSTSMAAITIMVLYIMNDVYRADFYSHPILLWAFPLVLFLWVSRIWLLCHRGDLHEDPVVFALHDRTSLSLGAVMSVAFLLAWLI